MNDVSYDNLRIGVIAEMLPKAQLAVDATLLMPVESPAPIVFCAGEGNYCIDTENRRYLDFGGGLGVNLLGYSDKEIVDTIISQAKTLIHCGSEFLNENQLRCAGFLRSITDFDNFFFSNSGAEANEAALKLTRRYFLKQGIPRTQIITCKGSFHGRTLFNISAAGNPAHSNDFSPLVPGFSHVTFNSSDELRALVDDGTAAIFVETIQTRDGVRELMPDFVECINDLRDIHGILVVADEIQTGGGRTGKYLSSRDLGLRTDIVTLGKGLAGGLPIGVTATTARIGSFLSAGTHGTTFGGGPLVMSVACCIANRIATAAFLQQVSSLGEKFIQRLYKCHLKYVDLGAPTGKGLLLGIPLRGRLIGRSGELQRYALERGLIVRTSGPSALRFTPPLTIKAEEIETGISILEQVIKDM